MAANAWTWITGSALRRGASVMPSPPRVSLLAEERPDLVGRLADRNDAEQVAVGPAQCGGLDRHAIGGDLPRSLLHVWRVEDQVGRRVDDERRQPDLARVGREELVRLGE